MSSKFNKLSPKRKVFVAALFGEAKFNATLAAKTAGYKFPEKQGSRLLNFVGVKDAINEMIAENFINLEDINYILGKLAWDFSNPTIQLRSIELLLRAYGMLGSGEASLNVNINNQLPIDPKEINLNYATQEELQLISRNEASPKLLWNIHNRTAKPLEIGDNKND